MPRHSISGPAPVRINQGQDAFVRATFHQEPFDAERRIRREWFGARQIESFELFSRVPLDHPELDMVLEKTDPITERGEIGDQVCPDPPHDFPEMFPRRQAFQMAKEPDERQIDGGIQPREHLTFHAKMLGRDHRTASIKPLRGLQPVAKEERVLIESLRLKNETESTDRRMFFVELMMIKISTSRVMLAPHVDHADPDAVQILLGGIAAQDFDGMKRKEQATSQEIILMGAPWMGDDVLNRLGHRPGEGNRDVEPRQPRLRPAFIPML